MTKKNKTKQMPWNKLNDISNEDMIIWPSIITFQISVWPWPSPHSSMCLFEFEKLRIGLFCPLSFQYLLNLTWQNDHDDIWVTETKTMQKYYKYLPVIYQLSSVSLECYALIVSAQTATMSYPLYLWEAIRTFFDCCDISGP